MGVLYRYRKGKRKEKAKDRKNLDNLIKIRKKDTRSIMALRIGVTMKYSVKVVRNYYNTKAIMEQKQTDERFFSDSLDCALIAYNSTIIGERIASEMHNVNGSSNIYVSLIVRTNGESIVLESTFIHNGEVQ